MRIAVVGAGLAGLRTAQRLVDGGHEVLVYEARDRVGGRLLTVQAEGDGYFDAGGEWVDADHHRVLALMGRYGLTPERPEMWPGTVFLGGKRRSEGDVHPDMIRVEAAAERLSLGLVEPFWSESNLYLDQRSLGDWLDDVCETAEGRGLVEAVFRSDEGEDTKRVGLLGWLVAYRNSLDRPDGAMSAFRIPGGSGSLCERMAEEFADRVFLDRPLRSVELKDEGVECWFDGEVAFVDRLVVAVPAPCLLKIDWPFDLPDEYRAAWSAISMSRTVKVILEYESAWWERSSWSGRLLTDLACQQVWIGGRDGAKVLNCYICGSAVDQLMVGDPVGDCARAIESVFEDAKGVGYEGILQDWVSDEWSGGGFPSLPMGAVGAARGLLSQAWGRVHFAGDHTAEWFGFMEGALESADRVVGEIMAK